METTITKGVKISVEVAFQGEHREPRSTQFIFAYRITIENQNDYTVQLMRRHWFILSGNGNKREVEGPGVVGDFPILAPKATYQYVSSCHLPVEIGKMYGTYLMKKTEDESTFNVEIPAFTMMVPYILN